MVALVEQEQIALGVVSEPAKERLTYAVRGGGCWKRDGAPNGEPGWVSARSEPTLCRVSACSELAGATLVQSHSRNPGQPSPQMKALQPARVVENLLRRDQARYGRPEARLTSTSTPTTPSTIGDICAGHILVDEAGGRVTGLGGQELRYGLPGAWQRHGLLASNGKTSRSGRPSFNLESIFLSGRSLRSTGRLSPWIRLLLSLNSGRMIALLFTAKSRPARRFCPIFKSWSFPLAGLLLCLLWYVPIMAERSSSSNP